MSLDRFEARFAVLDRIPEALFPAVVTHTHGTLLTRARGLMQWREALLAGRLPDENELCWPDPSLRRVILKRLEALDIVRHCQQEEALTDDVLESILEGVASAEDYFRKAGDFDDRGNALRQTIDRSVYRGGTREFVESKEVINNPYDFHDRTSTSEITRYADASHPLSKGYRMLAEQLLVILQNKIQKYEEGYHWREKILS